MSDNDLESVLEQRIKDLLALCTEPKDLTPAVKVAIEFWEKRYGAKPQDKWGTMLTGKTNGGQA